MTVCNPDIFIHLRVKNISLYLMAFFYIIAGINHILFPSLYMNIVPAWIPGHEALINITGVCETVLGMLLFPLLTRRMSAWGIVILLIAIFPANVQMMLNYFHQHNPFLWLSILRLPLQILLIWWAYSLTKPMISKADGSAL